jgi:hypothetical protein
MPCKDGRSSKTNVSVTLLPSCSLVWRQVSSDKKGAKAKVFPPIAHEET